MHNRDIKQDRAQGTYAFTSYLSDIETNTAAVLKKKNFTLCSFSFSLWTLVKTVLSSIDSIFNIPQQQANIWHSSKALKKKNGILVHVTDIKDPDLGMKAFQAFNGAY